MGWFGFNGGSALVGGNLAVSAVISTHISACCAAVVSLMLASRHKRPGATAMFNGVLSGLAGITAASGYVSTQATVVIGCLSGVIAHYGVHWSKAHNIDDALDVHWVHGATGVVGAVLLGVFGRSSAVEQVRDMEHLSISWNQIAIQVVGVVVVAVYAGVMTYLILLAMAQHFGSLIHDDEAQKLGLDWVDHGEVAYHKMNVLPSASTSHELGADLNAAEGGSLRPGMRGRQSQALAKSSSYDDLSQLPFEDEYFRSVVPDLSASSSAVGARYGSVN